VERGLSFQRERRQPHPGRAARVQGKAANPKALIPTKAAFKVFDYDQVTRNDSVGVVYVDLNPLITLQSVKEIAGWFPIYDSLRGARGELYLAVKLDYIDNANPFKESSAGVLFYSSTSFPEGYQTKLLGFVEELIYADDPEYHWSDNFRSSRFSNEERQRTFSELAGKVRRLVGRKVREMVLSVCVCGNYESQIFFVREEMLSLDTCYPLTSRPRLEILLPEQLERPAPFSKRASTFPVCFHFTRS